MESSEEKTKAGISSLPTGSPVSRAGSNLSMDGARPPQTCPACDCSFEEHTPALEEQLAMRKESTGWGHNS